jgi:hypothetical protein
MKIIAFVIQASEINSILEYFGMPTEAPKVHEAREPPQSELWSGLSETKEHLNDIDVADQDQSVYW